TTAADGAYAFKEIDLAAALKKRRKTSPDFQVRVLSGEKLLATSLVRFNAPTKVTLNVQLPDDAAGLPSEYEALTAGLQTYYDGKLSALKETAQQQDITYLANRSGWDARLVALGALASQLSEAKPVAAAGKAPVKDVVDKSPAAHGLGNLQPELY